VIGDAAWFVRVAGGAAAALGAILISFLADVLPG
jgi:hypothetical protein